MEHFSRRTFMTAMGAFCCLPDVIADTPHPEPLVRFGMITDIHHPDEAGRLPKLATAVAVLNARKVDFLIELGDLKDSYYNGGKTWEQDLLEGENALRAFNGPLYHVLGNHDMDYVSKPDFLSRISNGADPNGPHPERGYYSFERKGVKFIVLDACFDAKGRDYCKYRSSESGKVGDWTKAYVCDEEMEWLKAELAAAGRPVIVFSHQRLDAALSDGDHRITNAAAVRDVLSRSHKVKAAFAGHYHPGGKSNEGGVFYYGLKAVRLASKSTATDNSFAEVACYPDGHVSVVHFTKA